MLKNRIKMIVVAAGCCVLIATAFAKSTTPKALYLIAAETADVVQTSKAHYTLTLTNPHVDYFTDRPVREAGDVALQRFVKTWTEGHDNFSTDNPNAALVADVSATTQEPVREFIVLSHLVYDEQPAALHFDVTALDGTHLTAGHFNHVTVFVDNIGAALGCHGGVVDHHCV